MLSAEGISLETLGFMQVIIERWADVDVDGLGVVRMMRF